MSMPMVTYIHSPIHICSTINTKWHLCILLYCITTTSLDRCLSPWSFAYKYNVSVYILCIRFWHAHTRTLIFLIETIELFRIEKKEVFFRFFIRLCFFATVIVVLYVRCILMCRFKPLRSPFSIYVGMLFAMQCYTHNGAT